MFLLFVLLTVPRRMFLFCSLLIVPRWVHVSVVRIPDRSKTHVSVVCITDRSKAYVSAELTTRMFTDRSETHGSDAALLELLVLGYSLSPVFIFIIMFYSAILYAYSSIYTYLYSVGEEV